MIISEEKLRRCRKKAVKTIAPSPCAGMQIAQELEIFGQRQSVSQDYALLTRRSETLFSLSGRASKIEFLMAF
jgi:hypothetical protein